VNLTLGTNNPRKVLTTTCPFAHSEHEYKEQLVPALDALLINLERDPAFSNSASLLHGLCYIAPTGDVADKAPIGAAKHIAGGVSPSRPVRERAPPERLSEVVSPRASVSDTHTAAELFPKNGKKQKCIGRPPRSVDGKDADKDGATCRPSVAEYRQASELNIKLTEGMPRLTLPLI